MKRLFDALVGRSGIEGNEACVTLDTLDVSSSTPKLKCNCKKEKKKKKKRKARKKGKKEMTTVVVYLLVRFFAYVYLDDDATCV